MIVERHPQQQQRLLAGLRADFAVTEAENYPAVYQVLQGENPPDVVLLDIEETRSGLRDGLQVIREIDASPLDTIVIGMSGNQARSVSLKVMEAGAYDYFPKPVDLEVLRVILNRAVEKQEIERENRILRDELFRQQSFGDLVGASAPMQKVYEAIRRIAESSATVIVRGDSGTGKELVARSIHEHSGRADGPFVSVNCGALPESLMEAELFGYERGAFTGATGTKEGRFELAHRGTLFLDEIGTLGLALQTKLLRVLEEREFMRLGGKKNIKVDVRLITATNEDLEQSVKCGAFREDLYYRIQVVPIDVPPLRERVEDIPLLVNYFLQVYCAANHVALKRLDEEAMRALEQYAWPGNVRELQNVVQRVVLMTPESAVGVKDLPPPILGGRPGLSDGEPRIPASGFSLVDELARQEREWLKAALARAGGVKIDAARLLGLKKNQMDYLCRKHGVAR